MPAKQRISLEQIKNAALKRESRAGQPVRIWSGEKSGWWRPHARGYTRDPKQAGLYDFEDAFQSTSHCGPEKRIAFEPA
ncbi:hypothetical protein E0F66_11915, partial [Streptococcus pyogenes]